ncbi:hypothetical protein ACFU53_15970 [Streptomyces sp. NPDC057474]|uniref:hypothetical protein n=1 Tax=Streptomyces sp. NPDC057474 TaxID=3346144 RepID=UPI0036875DFD
MLNTEIQASTATNQPVPCMKTEGRKVRVTFDPKKTGAPAAFLTDGAREHTEPTEEQTAARAFVDHVEATKGPQGLDRLHAALPAIVDKAMRDTVPSQYTPALAAAVAEDIFARLMAARANSTRCTDGVAWCDGDPVNHTDDDDHRHQGAEHTLNGSYLCDPGTEGIATFYLAKWRDSQPHLVFQGTGLWADIDLAQVDELIGDAVPWLTQLIATRRHLSILLNPGRTPFEETGEQQTASAGFDLATRAMDVALENTADRAGTLRALRTFLDMAEAEQA